MMEFKTLFYKNRENDRKNVSMSEEVVVNKDIDVIVSDYLNKDDTDYAIMINGNWGCGKTFYIKNGLEKVIERTQCNCSEDNKIKNYSMALVTLYGISSPEDFSMRVFLGINEWANNKWLGILGSVSSKAASVVGVDLSKKDVKMLTSITEDKVLVFDDLERIAFDKISLIEVLGLINKYVENDKRKVIIVCNEEGIEKDVLQDYLKFKEKTVRFCCTYKADINAIFDVIVLKQKDKYKEYLSAQKLPILDLFEKGGEKNIRTLKFFIETMENIFNSCSQSLKCYDEVNKILLTTTLIYCMELKIGKGKEELMELKPKYKLDLDNIDFNGRIENLNKKEIYECEVKEKYGSEYDNNMHRIEIIIDYLFTGMLNTKSLNEYIQLLDIEFDNRRTKPEMKALQYLQNYPALDDDQIIPNIEYLTKAIEKGNLNLYELLSVYSTLIIYDYNHISNFKLTDEFDNNFKKAMDLCSESHIYDPSFDMRVPIWSNDQEEAAQKYNTMKKIASIINRKSKFKHDSNEIERYFTFAEEENLNAMIEYRANPNKKMELADFDWNRVWHIIIDKKNPIAVEMIKFIEFQLSISNGPFSKEESIIKEFFPIIEKYVNEDRDNRIRKMYIKELYRKIKGWKR